jgi:hypothetical protein
MNDPDPVLYYCPICGNSFDNVRKALSRYHRLWICPDCGRREAAGPLRLIHEIIIDDGETVRELRKRIDVLEFKVRVAEDLKETFRKRWIAGKHFDSTIEKMQCTCRELLLRLAEVSRERNKFIAQSLNVDLTDMDQKVTGRLQAQLNEVTRVNM